MVRAAYAIPPSVVLRVRGMIEMPVPKKRMSERRPYFCEAHSLRAVIWRYWGVIRSRAAKQLTTSIVNWLTPACENLPRMLTGVVIAAFANETQSTVAVCSNDIGYVIAKLLLISIPD